MPSEHRITGLEEGEVQTITNDFGDFVLIRLPLNNSEYGYKLIDTTRAVVALQTHCESHNEMMRDAITDKTNDYMEDSK
tara:strand:- start:21502 stop:21738 length:237 start_codon:yes stop_codon:yes gene_type:complete